MLTVKILGFVYTRRAPHFRASFIEKSLVQLARAPRKRIFQAQRSIMPLFIRADHSSYPCSLQESILAFEITWKLCDAFFSRESFVLRKIDFDGWVRVVEPLTDRLE